jgi:hypothetical protein
MQLRCQSNIFEAMARCEFFGATGNKGFDRSMIAGTNTVWWQLVDHHTIV